MYLIHTRSSKRCNLASWQMEKRVTNNFNFIKNKIKIRAKEKLFTLCEQNNIDNYPLDLMIDNMFTNKDILQ